MLKRLMGLALGIVLIVLGANTPAFAVGEDVFVVPRVPVQARADGARQAKNQAQSAGRRRAMDILLRRLTIEEDWAYLPRLAAGYAPEATGDFTGAGKSALDLAPGDLFDLESGFEVYEEKSSSTSYRAFITYRFKPDLVRARLKTAGIPYSEAQTRTALVLPVLQTDSGAYLWEENNPWMAAWKVRPYNNELTPMTAPLGDLEDSSMISARQALALNGPKLRALAERYSVSQVIVAHARLRQENGEDRLHVRLINGHRESGHTSLEGLGGLQDSELVEEEAAALPSTPRMFDDQMAAKVGDVLADKWFKEASGNFPLLAEAAIDATIAKYASGWKARTLIDHSAVSVLSTTAFFNSINDWAKIRAALVGTPLVGSVQVRALSRRGAEMSIRSFGDPGKLIVAMEAQGLTMWSPGDDLWYIATPDAARGVRDYRPRRRRSRVFGEAETDETTPPSDNYLVPASMPPPDPLEN